jgi:hypothetical protein
MAIIEKKCWPDSFEKILSGEKTFDVRLADFHCNVGDILLLKEYNPETKEYTGRVIEKKIAFILKTNESKYWRKEEIERFGFQVFALK